MTADSELLRDRTGDLELDDDDEFSVDGQAPPPPVFVRPLSTSADGNDVFVNRLKLGNNLLTTSMTVSIIDSIEESTIYRGSTATRVPWFSTRATS